MLAGQQEDSSAVVRITSCFALLAYLHSHVRLFQTEIFA
jgi:hypothetical protein